MTNDRDFPYAQTAALQGNLPYFGRLRRPGVVKSEGLISGCLEQITEIMNHGQHVLRPFADQVRLACGRLGPNPPYARLNRVLRSLSGGDPSMILMELD
jgi:hypothetical protein